MEIFPQYDVVIVGSGVAGAIIAKQLSEKGKRVLILEAGPEEREREYSSRFALSTAKVPGCPYPPEIYQPDKVNAPKVSVLELGCGPENSYLVQKGPNPFMSMYERVLGGSTWTWMGQVPRYCPSDFKMKTKYGKGKNWPIKYEDLVPYYQKAEAELGASAQIENPKSEKEVQGLETVTKYINVWFDVGYKYPMPRITPNLFDNLLASKVNGMRLKGFENPLYVTGDPAARNSQMPYEGRPPCHYINTCIPVCPVRAKYDATSTLNKLNRNLVSIQTQKVVDKILIDENGNVSGVHYLEYKEPQGPCTGEGIARGAAYVIAAHAMETPKILLNSRNDRLPNGAANSSDEVGRNLMDHPNYLGWGLTPKGEDVYNHSGPICSATIDTLRDGKFRKDRSAFRIVIGNQGWNWPTGDPYTTTNDFIDGTNNAQLNPKGKKHFGKELRKNLGNKLRREVYLNYLVEQLPSRENRVCLSDKYTDHLGIPRPEIHYHIGEYEKKGFEAAKNVTDAIFKKAGIKQYTHLTSNISQFTYKKEEYQYFGAGHVIGTCCMGKSKKDSVVDSYQQSWDHPNLYIAGASSLVTSGTGNPTLTVAALSFRTAEKILENI